MEEEVYKPKIYNIYQYMVWKFLEDPVNARWTSEINIAIGLVKEHGEDVFKDLQPDFKMGSLLQFTTEKYKRYLKKQKKLSELDFRKEHAILDKEVEIEEVEINKKPKTLIDFLRHGSKEEEESK
tara:strand:+ start:19306 stop:19680 length:375 start_codon:yes stop_codon:yes gene_type:complete